MLYLKWITIKILSILFCDLWKSVDLQFQVCVVEVINASKYFKNIYQDGNTKQYLFLREIK